MRIPVAWVVAAAVLAGCANTVQTTSGAAYRAARPQLDARDASAIDVAVDKAAAVEPTLRFPARIGLARLSGGQIGAVPPREADSWIAFAQAHPEYGSFVPLSPLVAAAARSVAGDAAKTVVDQVRLGAARQHIDAVLIYTVGGTQTDGSSALSVLDLTIIGAYLVPSRRVAGEAAASGLLLDVRNGYPYGTANAVADAKGFVPSVGSFDRSRALEDDAAVAAVGKLTAEVETMMGKLRIELQNRELAVLRAEQAAPHPAATARRGRRNAAL